MKTRFASARTHTHTQIFNLPNLTPVHKHTHAHSCHALLSSIVNMLYIYKDTYTHLNPPPLTHHTQQFMYSLSAWRALSYKSPGWGCGCWRRKSCRRTPFPLQERPATACARRAGQGGLAGRAASCSAAGGAVLATLASSPCSCVWVAWGRWQTPRCRAAPVAAVAAA